MSTIGRVASVQDSEEADVIARASSPPAPPQAGTAASGKGRSRGGCGGGGRASAGSAGRADSGSGTLSVAARAAAPRRDAPAAPVADPSDKRRKTWDSVAQHSKLRRSFNGKLTTLRETFDTTLKRLSDMEESIW